MPVLSLFCENEICTYIKHPEIKFNIEPILSYSLIKKIKKNLFSYS